MLYNILQGPLLTEVRTSYSPWADQTTRLYKDANYLEVEYTIGPIPIKYVIATYKTHDNGLIEFFLT